MLIFAHLGLTLAAAKLAERFGLRPEILFVALGSILPDLIDKPLGYMIYGSMATGRIYAHTLLFLILIATFAAIFRSPALGSISFGILCHLVLDSIWKTPAILLWPLLGDFPVNLHLSVFGYFEMLMRGLENPEIFVSETLGFFYLAILIVQNRDDTFGAAKKIAKYLSN